VIRAAILLGDFAETDTGSGKVHIIGAGWSMTGPAPGPHAVVAFIQVPADRVEGGPIPVTLRLTDRAGQLVEVQGPAGMQRLELTGQVEMQVPEGWDHSTALQAIFSVNLMGIPLQPGQSYTWSVEVDGKDLASTEFQVRSAPAAQPVRADDEDAVGQPAE
jgi:hypothetical protein